MASDKTLNAKNLAALGAERLAELLLDLAAGNTAAKRRLRIELASRRGGSDVAAEIRKRLVTIAKSRSFVGWRKIRAFADDLDSQRVAIMAHVAPTSPAEAFDLLWRLLEMAPAIYDRCDDGKGMIGAVIAAARDDLGAVAGAALLEPGALADRVFAGVNANGYGQFDGLIALLAAPLGQHGLEILKAKFEELAARQPARPNQYGRNVIGHASDGTPLFEDDFDTRQRAKTTRTALCEIADAVDDVDGYAACFSSDERADPAIAASIAQRLLAAGRAAQAMAALAVAEDNFRKSRLSPDWQRVWIDTLEAVGQTAAAQAERWAEFERDLDADSLRAHIRRLPDFDDEEAEHRALGHASQFPDMGKALGLLIEWPAHDLAAKLVLTRQGELDGDRYELLTHAAEALDQRHPLAATLALRAMIDFALINARAKRYTHAARHLLTCEHLARRIEDFGDRRDHDAYVAHLRLSHGRKSGFWSV